MRGAQALYLRALIPAARAAARLAADDNSALTLGLRVQALDLHIAAECFFREFWDLQHVMLPISQQMTEAGFKGDQDLPHCELLPESTRICFMRANVVRACLLCLCWACDCVLCWDADALSCCCTSAATGSRTAGQSCGRIVTGICWCLELQLITACPCCRPQRCWTWGCPTCWSSRTPRM